MAQERRQFIGLSDDEAQEFEGLPREITAATSRDTLRVHTEAHPEGVLLANETYVNEKVSEKFNELDQRVDEVETKLEELKPLQNTVVVEARLEALNWHNYTSPVAGQSFSYRAMSEIRAAQLPVSGWSWKGNAPVSASLTFEGNADEIAKLAPLAEVHCHHLEDGSNTWLFAVFANELPSGTITGKLELHCGDEEKDAKDTYTVKQFYCVAATGSLLAKGGGGGTTVVAKNFSGAAIAAGQKVWLYNEPLVEEESVKTLNFTTSSGASTYEGIMNRTGTLVFQSSKCYWPETDTYGSGYSIYDSKRFHYDDYGNILTSNYMLTSDTVVRLPAVLGQDGFYYTNTTTSTTKVLVRKYKAPDYQEIEKEWEVKGISTNHYDSTNASAMIIGDIYYYTYGSTYYMGKVDYNSDTIEVGSTNTVAGLSYPMLYYTTKDNKLIIAPGNWNSYDYYRQVYLLTRDRDGKLQRFTSSNYELNYVQNAMAGGGAGSGAYINFNRQTGVLIIPKGKYNNLDKGYMFKYNPSKGDFDTIYTGDFRYITTVTDDLRLMFTNLNKLVTLKTDETVSGYKAVSYGNLNQNVITGIAQADAEPLAEFEAATLIPEEG